jgi:hypothetical protein
LVIGRFMVAVIAMVAGALPQLKVMTPPFPTAVLSALNVQLAAVPVPITVGFETTAGWPLDGTPALHEPLGFPAVPGGLPPVLVAPPVLVVPPVLVLPPVPALRISFEEPQPAYRKIGRTKANDERMRTSGGEKELKASSVEYPFRPNVGEGIRIGGRRLDQKTAWAERLTRRSTPLYDEPGS